MINKTNTIRAFFFLVIIGFCITIAPLFAPTAEAAELPCLQCHKSKNTGATIHPAIDMGCDICHQEPHKEEKPVLSLTAELPDLCFQCHDDSGFKKSSVHSAVAAGMCTSCHSPHASDNKKLLTATGGDLCFACHDSGAFTKNTQHSPVAEGECLFCHNPHSADNASNLEYPSEEICMNCHDMSGTHVLAGLGYKDEHPISGQADPSRKGKEISCLSCHTPHSSAYDSLFNHDGVKVKTICLSCHKKSFLRQ